MNEFLVNLASHPTSYILRRLINQTSNIFGVFNPLDYQNLMDVFTVLGLRDLNDANIEDLQDFIDSGFRSIFNRYNFGREIHPGTLNILIAAIMAFNRASVQPYRVVIYDNDDMPETVQFMNDIVRPAAQNLQMFALHHAPWVNPIFVARDAERLARERAQAAETHIARSLAEFRAMGGHEMASECPLCMEEFIKPSAKRMSPIFMPVIFHKDAKGKWFHPMHTMCVNDVQKDECPMCRVKVIWPKMMANRKIRPNSEPTSGRSVKRSPNRSVKRSPGRSVKRSPKTPGRSPSFKRRSADF
jgi:hypothetical protein